MGLHHAVAVGKGQKHHRVLQTLAGVDGDDLDQIFVTLQPHGLLFAVACTTRVHFIDLLGQPADQGLFTVDLTARRLQQFGQMQHIGQSPLAVALAAPAPGQFQHMQRLAQHGQHALPLPDRAQIAHLLGTLVQQFVLRGQRVKLVQRQAHGACAQGSAHASHVARLGHTTQPQAQVASFVAGKHRVTV